VEEPLERLARERGVRVRWRAFELRRTLPPRPVSPEAQRRVRRSRELVAPNLVLRPDYLRVSSRLALEGAKLAQQEGDFPSYHRAVYRACFRDGLDISDPDVLAAAAREAGLDEARFSRCLREGWMRPAVAEDLREAHRLGISAVPTLLMGRLQLVGARPYAQLVQAVERAAAAG
jgi:predicted DsbA family dithiol-disulfide isomerase